MTFSPVRRTSALKLPTLKSGIAPVSTDGRWISDVRPDPTQVALKRPFLPVPMCVSGSWKPSTEDSQQWQTMQYNQLPQQ